MIIHDKFIITSINIEKIDDECNSLGVQFVKCDDNEASQAYDIDTIPAVVFFEKEVPIIYEGDLLDEEELLQWLVSQLEKDEIDDVNEEQLDRMIKDGTTLAVLFCKC